MKFSGSRRIPTVQETKRLLHRVCGHAHRSPTLEIVAGSLQAIWRIDVLHDNIIEIRFLQIHDDGAPSNELKRTHRCIRWIDGYGTALRNLHDRLHDGSSIPHESVRHPQRVDFDSSIAIACVQPESLHGFPSRSIILHNLQNHSSHFLARFRREIEPVSYT